MWRGGVDVSSIDAKAMWAAEEALTDKQRRHRYRCGMRYKTLKEMHPWTYTMVQSFPEIHSVEPAPVEEKKEDAPVSTEAPAESTAAETPSSTETKTDTVSSEASSSSDPVEKLAEATEKLSIDEKKHDSDPEDSDSDSDDDQIEPPAPEIKYSPNAHINRKVTVFQGDITSLEIDAIVNAANRSLLGGGGVDGAIHSAAGDKLYTECLTLNGANTGETKITRGYNLPAKYVLHTVGPIGEIPDKLTSCYKTCLDLVEQHGLKTVAFCGVSTGIYGYPREAAANVALPTVREWLEVNHEKVDRVIFVNFLDVEQRTYLNLLPKYFPPAYDKDYFEEYSAKVQEWAKEVREPISDSESESEEEPQYVDSDSDDSDDNVAPASSDTAEAKPAADDTVPEPAPPSWN